MADFLYDLGVMIDAKAHAFCTRLWSATIGRTRFDPTIQVVMVFVFFNLIVPNPRSELLEILSGREVGPLSNIAFYVAYLFVAIMLCACFLNWTISRITSTQTVDWFNLRDRRAAWAVVLAIFAQSLVAGLIIQHLHLGDWTNIIDSHSLWGYAIVLMLSGPSSSGRRRRKKTESKLASLLERLQELVPRPA